MQPPITAGTILQNRYKIIKTLGQGGFGRTYLAEDQRRFNEFCAIKELIPGAMGTSAWEKAQELFGREAAILYQIKHPQVPQFREKFEQDQRLFLVQDYIEGKTYYDLLEERKAVGGAFTEAEMLRLMRYILPPIDYIHGKGIIHRDISPDNIMMRESDKLPILIDFGVVKELVTRLQSNNSTPQTYVGKLGYSPSEQIQTGQAYPSSDLYALAVSVIVLLTGKEPTELFDDNLLTWNWQRWVTVNPRFAQILNRMLSYKPGARYQSAAEVLEALDSLNQSTAAKPEVSRMQTLAVGNQAKLKHSPPPPQPGSVIPPQQNSILDRPLVLVVIFAAVTVFAGLGSWLVVKNVSDTSDSPSQPSPPQTFPSPLITPTPTPPTTNEPIIVSRRLNFGGSNRVNLKGSLKPNRIIEYTFRGEEGQRLTVVLVRENGVSLTVFGPNKELIDNAAKQVSYYRGKLPFTGRYSIQLNHLPEITQAEYTLRVTLKTRVRKTPLPRLKIKPTPTPEVKPTSTPEVKPTPTPEVKPTPTPEIEATPTPEIKPTPTPQIEATVPPIDDTPTPPSIKSTPTPKPPNPTIPPVDIFPTPKPTSPDEETNNPIVEPSPESNSEDS